MKLRLLAGVAIAVALGSTGCSQQKSYSDYILHKQIECKEAGGELHIFKDNSMVNGEKSLCILPGTKLETGND